MYKIYATSEKKNTFANTTFKKCFLQNRRKENTGLVKFTPNVELKESTICLFKN